MTATIRVWTAALVAAVLALAATALPAGSAAAPTPAQRLNIVPDPWLGPVVDDLREGRQLGRVLTDLLCPPVGEIDELVRGVPGLDKLTGLLRTGACNLDVLDYSYHAEFRRPDGTIAVTNVPAIVNVPTMLDVDGKPGADLVATIRVLSLEQLVVQVDRVGPLLADGVLKPLPVSVEAIIADPSKGSLPRKRIAYGFDAKESSAPTQWETVIRLTDVFGDPDPLKVGVDFNQSGATGPVAVTGELYDPDVRDGRRNRLGGAVRFAAPPSRASVDLALGDRIEARLRATTASRLDVVARIQDDDREQRVTAGIDQLPNQVDLAFDGRDDGRMRVDYDAGAPIAAIDAEYTERRGAPEYDAVTTTAEAHVRDLPQGVTLEQTGPESFRFATRGGKVGAVEAAFATGGTPVTDPAPGHYAKIVRDEHRSSVAGRILGLARASVDLGGPIVVDATLDPGLLRATVKTPELDAEATVRDLPHRLRLALDLEGPRVVYDGDGQPIDEIEVRAQSAKPLFARATHLQAKVRGIAASTELDIAHDEAGNVGLAASRPIGEVEIAASNGRDERLPDGRQGLILRDERERWSLYGRVFGLRQVAFRPEPTDLLVRAGDGKPFSLAATLHRRDGDLDVTGAIENLPRRAHVALVPEPEGGTRVEYDADAPIERVALSARGLRVLARGDRASVDVRGVPDRFHVRLPKGGTLIDAQASDPIGSIEVGVAEGALPPIPGGGDGLASVDTSQRFGLHGRISRLRGVRIETDPELRLTLDLPDAPGPFEYDLRRQADPWSPVDYLNGKIDRPQADTTIAFAREPNTRLTYRAAAPIGFIELNTTFGSLGLAELTLRDLPRKLDVCFDKGDGREGRGGRCWHGESPTDDPKIMSGYVDDGDSGDRPFQLDGLLCMEPDDEMICRDTNLRGLTVILTALRINELSFDVDDDTSPDLFLDTDDRDLQGNVEIRPGGDSLLEAFELRLPAGFRAQDRLVEAQGVKGGTIACPEGTYIGVTLDGLPDGNLEGLVCD